ncbi:MAG: hypothetical protein MUP17_09345 [candidate division Zixibacteria bacterium]|nr:hypothetical protein [candidate division Zixibacteria bacterium]
MSYLFSKRVFGGFARSIMLLSVAIGIPFVTFSNSSRAQPPIQPIIRSDTANLSIIDRMANLGRPRLKTYKQALFLLFSDTNGKRHLRSTYNSDLTGWKEVNLGGYQSWINDPSFIKQLGESSDSTTLLAWLVTDTDVIGFLEVSPSGSQVSFTPSPVYPAGAIAPDFTYAYHAASHYWIVVIHNLAINQIDVWLFDNDNKRFESVLQNPNSHTVTLQVSGNPLLAVWGDNILLRIGSDKWLTGRIVPVSAGPGLPRIQIIWNSPFDLHIEGREPIRLAVDHKKGVLYAATFDAPSTRGLVRHDYYFYSSTDGVQWSRLSERLNAGLDMQRNFDIGVTPSGGLMFMGIRQIDNAAQIEVFERGQWKDLSSKWQDLLGRSPSWATVVLASVGLRLLP